MSGHDHPVFSRFYTLLAGVEERGSVGAARSRACAQLHGRTLVVGLGPGFDLAHLPPAVTEVVASNRAPRCATQPRGGSPSSPATAPSR